MYENLATKYRPKTLADLMGQEAVKTTLTNAVKLNRVGHSYVFYGPRGCGKTTVARILAKTLNCHNPGPDGTPCGECSSCREIAESKSLDVIEIDAASNTAVDNVRSVIVDQVNFAPSRDKYKIYILDEVHMLSKGSFNALLKTLEEPPSHVVFIMATTEQEKVPPTILSRSQCFRFKFIPENEITERLKFVCGQEKLSIDSGSLRLITKASGGAMRDALTLLDRAASFCGNDITVSVLNDLLGRPNEELLQVLALALVNRDPAALHSAFDRIISGGYDVLSTMRELRNLISEAFFFKSGFAEGTEPIKGLPDNVSTGLLARLSRKLTVLIREVQYSDAMAVAAEVGLYTLIEIPQDLTSLVRRLEELETRLSSDGSAMYGGGASSENSDRLIRYGNNTPSKKKDDLTADLPSVPKTAQQQNVPDRANAENNSNPVNSGEFAEAWRKTLAKISAERPFLYDTLADCRLTHDGSGSVIIVARDLFFANRISFVLNDLSESMSGILGRKIDFTVTSGAQARKEAISVPVRKNEMPEMEAFPQKKTENKAESSPNYSEDSLSQEEEPLPEDGEAAEITEFEDAPQDKPALAAEPLPKKKPAKPAEAPQEHKPVAKKPVQTFAKEKSGSDTARHTAAHLEYVSPDNVPAEFALLREVFGQGITRVNKVL